MEEQTKTNDWLTNEEEELNKQTTFDGEKLPSLQFEENKVTAFTVDFTEPFNEWEDTENKSTKAIIPVSQGEVKLNLWLNKKNPLYKDLIHAGKKFDYEGYEWVKSEFGFHMSHPNTFYKGGIIGKVNIVDCVEKSDSEWFSGPYGFEFEDAKPIDFIPCQGQLKFFEVDYGI